jgi:hypothetical protein
VATPPGHLSPPFSVPKSSHLTNQPGRHDAQSLPFLKSIPTSKSTSILKYPTIAARYIQNRSQIFLLPNGPGPRISKPTLTRPAASWKNNKFIKSWIKLTSMTHTYLHCVSTHTLSLLQHLNISSFYKSVSLTNSSSPQQTNSIPSISHLFQPEHLPSTKNPTIQPSDRAAVQLTNHHAPYYIPIHPDPPPLPSSRQRQLERHPPRLQHSRRPSLRLHE